MHFQQFSTICLEGVSTSLPCLSDSLQVFQEKATSDKSKDAARSILNFFSGFDAFALPLPTDNKDVLHNMSESKDCLNAPFLKDLIQFQALMKDVIVAKKSVKTEEPVTGEGRVAFKQSNVVFA